MPVSLEVLQRRYPGAVSFRFGDQAELSAGLLELVRTGRKTATCSAMRDVESGDQDMPVVGHCDIALDWDGRPAFVIETTDLRICRFDEVDEAFALAEGENDTLAGWQRDHQAYFARNGGFSADMIVICERFRVVEDLA